MPAKSSSRPTSRPRLCAPLVGTPPRTRTRILFFRLPQGAYPLLGGSGHTCGETWLRLLSRLLDAEPGDIKGRQEQQSKQRRDKEPPDDRIGHGSPEDFRRNRD